MILLLSGEQKIMVENYGEEISALRDDLKAYLDKVYFGKQLALN